MLEAASAEAFHATAAKYDVLNPPALRRLVGYGDFVYRAVRERGEQLFLTGADDTREVVLL